MPSEVLDRRKICVIHGLRGMGKSQLAIEYACNRHTLRTIQTVATEGQELVYAMAES